MKRYYKFIFLFLFVNFALCNSLYAFGLTSSANRVKLSHTATITLDVSPGQVSGYTYQWSSDIGSITGTSNIVTFNAPAAKGKATISVTVNQSGSPVYTGSISVLVFKKIMVIQCDDYDYCDWNGPSYIRPNWKEYCDYMTNTAHMKFSIGLICSSLDTGNAAWRATTQNYINSGYFEIFFHGITHQYTEFDTSQSVAQQAATFRTGIDNCIAKFGYTMHGFQAPGGTDDADTVTAINSIPEMKYWLNTYQSGFSGFTFLPGDGTYVIQTEPHGVQTPDYALFTGQYNGAASLEMGHTLMHPPWWSNPADLNTWKQIVAFLHADGATIIFPYDYARMVNDPTFVADEGPGGGDTTAPGNITTVNDGTGSDMDSTTLTTQLSANWTAASDAQSGISGYKYAIGSSPAGTNVAGWATIGNVTMVTRTGLSLSNGARYYFTVKAINGSGLESASATNSNGQTVSTGGGGDTTPPGAPSAVRDGTSATADLGSTSLTTQLSANWDASTDGESTITLYEYAIGTILGGIDTKGWTANSANLNVTASGLALTAGTTYYFSVRATSSGGTGLARNSSGQYVYAQGVTPPPPGNSKIYPNPFNLSRQGGMKFSINGTAQGELSIYTMAWKLVRKVTGTSEINWDGKNDSGEKAARGVYFYILKDGNGKKTNGKIAVVD